MRREKRRRPTSGQPGREPGSTSSTAGTTLSAGRVGRAHGLDGSFYVTRALPRLLSEGSVVSVSGRRAAIRRRAGTEERPIIRLEGVDDRAAAEGLRGAELEVWAEEAPALGEEEWWAHELEGCTVFAGARLIGRVERLIALPSCEALEVEPAGGGAAILVPLVRDAIARVAPEERRIDVDADFLDLEGSTGRGP